MIEALLRSPSRRVRQLEALLHEPLPEVAARAQRVHRSMHGAVVRLFAPLYVSNECVNTCTYCGLSRERSGLRGTLSPDEVEHEARVLVGRGIRSILLVSGEHPRVSVRYLTQVIERLRARVSSLGIEVQLLEAEEYAKLCEAGLESVVLYQETYDRKRYAALHPRGPKRDFDARLTMAERAARGGARRLGLGVLLGLAPPEQDLIALAAHVDHVIRSCPSCAVTVSLPRLRPTADGQSPGYLVSNELLVRAYAAFRLAFPEVGLVLSTREPAWLRDGLFCLGITHASAESSTAPGGYGDSSGGRAHRTERGRRLPVAAEETQPALSQFAISDTRTVDEVARALRQLGIEPVWKDSDTSLMFDEGTIR